MSTSRHLVVDLGRICGDVTEHAKHLRFDDNGAKTLFTGSGSETGTTVPAEEQTEGDDDDTPDVTTLTQDYRTYTDEGSSFALRRPRPETKDPVVRLDGLPSTRPLSAKPVKRTTKPERRGPLKKGDPGGPLSSVGPRSGPRLSKGESPSSDIDPEPLDGVGEGEQELVPVRAEPEVTSEEQFEHDRNT